MSRRWGALWAEVVRFWSEVEPGTSIALVRILVGLCIAYDLLYLFHLDLVLPLFAAEEAGGWSNILTRSAYPPWVAAFGASQGSARALHGLMTLGAVALTLGFRTRLAAAVVLVGWMQWVQILPAADRGIDQLMRHMLVLMVVGDFGRTLSLDAMVRTGRFVDPTPVPSWPRKLVIGQMILMYTTAGLLKTGLSWWPMGGFAALYFALQDPSVAAYDFGWTRDQPWFFFTQVGTATTILYQTTYPLVLLLLFWRRYPHWGGRVARFCNRYRVEWLWLGIGAWFHLSLAVVMNLGIFPWAMLALYPAWVAPSEWSLLRRFGQRQAPRNAG